MQGIHFQENYIQRLPAGLSVEQIIRQLAQPLVAAELVVPDFADHVLKREATYPTGLPTEPPCVAIPHTDHKHVRHNAIAVGILPEPVEFADMGGDPDPVPVRVIFLLALSESNKQLNGLDYGDDSGYALYASPACDGNNRNTHSNLKQNERTR